MGPEYATQAWIYCVICACQPFSDFLFPSSDRLVLLSFFTLLFGVSRFYWECSAFPFLCFTEYRSSCYSDSNRPPPNTAGVSRQGSHLRGVPLGRGAVRFRRPGDALSAVPARDAPALLRAPRRPVSALREDGGSSAVGCRGGGGGGPAGGGGRREGGRRSRAAGGWWRTGGEAERRPAAGGGAAEAQGAGGGTGRCRWRLGGARRCGWRLGGAGGLTVAVMARTLCDNYSVFLGAVQQCAF